MRVSNQRRARAVATATALVAMTQLASAGSADALIYLRNSSAVQNASGSSTLVMPVPSGVVAGDVLITSVHADGSSSTAFTPPSGWTSIYNGTENFGYSQVYWRVAGSSEPASYTWTLGATRKAVGQMGAYLGVDTAAPVETSATGGGTSGTTATAPTITTTFANSLVVMGMSAYPAGSFTITPPTGTTARPQTFTTGGGSVLGTQSVDYTRATAGATGTKAFTYSAGGAWGAISFALKPATGVLSFAKAPNLPALPSVTLNGQSQTKNATMPDFAVDDTTSGSGWNVTVNGDSSAGKSAVFKQYCSNGASACGSDAANSYVTGGRTLAAGSLKINSTGASWTGGSGSAPTFQCGSGCSGDAGAATKIVSASASGGLGGWSTTGLSATSLALSAPTTVRTLPANEVYRADVVWTLASGP